MAETPFTLGSFGGLNVIADAMDVGAAGAVSMLNVDLDVRGALRTRDGSSNHTASAAANAYRALFAASASALLGVRGGGAINCVIEAIDSSGAVTTSTTGSPGTPSLSSFASVGTSSATTTYIACDGFGVNVKTWDGSAFATASFTGSGTKPSTTDLLASWGERLVATDRLNTNARVKFSNAGDATIFDTNDFVLPDAGDGLLNRALVTFGPYLLLFRDTKMFSFYGVGTAAAGTPIFNFTRFVHGNIGQWMGCVVGDDAVYVLTSTGLYKTTGTQPLSLVSEMPRALYGNLISVSPATGYSYSPGAMYVRRLYFGAVSFGGSTIDRTLVFDLLANEWLLWDIAAQSMTVTRFSTTIPELMFGLPSGHVGKLSASSTADPGGAIAWSYKTGKYPLADPGRVAVANETSLVGFGTVTVALDSDAYATQTATVTLGTAPTLAEGWPTPLDQEGRWLQTTLSGTGVARITDVKHYISSVRGAGED